MSFKFYGLFLTAILIIFSSCGHDEDPFASGSGGINATFKANYDVISSVGIARGGDETLSAPDVSKFSVHLIKEDGSFDKKWASFAEFPKDDKFTTGAYTLEGNYGSMDDEGFDKPYFYGKTDFNVYDGETSQVSVLCELANTMISIEYTDAFKNYFKDYSAAVHSVGGTYVDFVKDETRAAYVKPGNISIKLSLTKTNGVTTTFEPAQIPNAEAKTHYKIKFDVNGGEVGEGTLLISFDSTTESVPVEVQLSNELFNAAPPTIKSTGYDNNSPVNVMEGDAAPNKLQSLVTALSGINSVILTTSSESLKSNGWPEEIDLVAATEAQKTLLSNLGLSVKGLWGNVDKMATVDFTEVVKNLKVVNGSSTHTFTLQVKDKYTKVCETPVVLTVNTPSVNLAIGQPENIFVGQASTEAIITYNGSDFESNVKIMAINEYGAWTPCTVNSVTKNQNTYTVVFKLPPSNENVKVKASYKNGMKESNTVTYVRINPSYSISVGETSVWAKKAVVKFIVDDTNLLDLMTQYAVIYLKTGASDWKKATIVRNSAAGTIDVVGLSPSTLYTVRASLSENPSNTSFSNEESFTTESITDLPNGNFENGSGTIAISSINQGGKYSNLTNWVAKYNTTSINVNEPDGWASVNAKTCSMNASTKNTWFMVPSTYIIAAAQSGNNAVEIRNVAWDLAGTEPGRDTRGDTQNWSSKVPNIANRAAGKLFLGTYAFDSSSSTETYNEGFAISSRPSKLNGYYKYSNDANDNDEKGVVMIQVLNGNDIIGTGTLNLSAAGDYTPFSVPVAYSALDKKATGIKVMFSSSNHASYSISTENANVKTTNYAQPAISTGAVLCVDNVSLSYE